MVLTLDFKSPVPLYVQMRNQIVIGISEGVLKPGERLPTVRALASECGINTMTVNKAYQLLKQEGYIDADRRSGAMVKAEFPKRDSIPQEEADVLKLLVSEAKIGGMSKSSFLNKCESLWEELSWQQI